MQVLLDAEPTKVCNNCKVEKSVKEYHPNKTCKYGVTGTCIPCSNEKTRGWYSSHRKRLQESANERNRSRKLKAIEYFGNQCLDCGLSYHPCVYQFHHLDPNGKDVNPSAAMKGDESKMWKELKKCVMLCANCHMVRHHVKGE